MIDAIRSLKRPLAWLHSLQPDDTFEVADQTSRTFRLATTPFLDNFRIAADSPRMFRARTAWQQSIQERVRLSSYLTQRGGNRQVLKVSPETVMCDWKLAKVCLGHSFASKWKFRLTEDSDTYICPVVYTTLREAQVGAVVLDRQSVVPLYYQIQQRLSEQIRSGELKPGELVPSEQEISARLGVSRMTARQALKSLCSRGLAYSQRGKGTFVSRMKLEKNFRQLLSFSEEMKDRGSRPRSKVLAFKRIHADEEVAEALHLSPAEEVFFLRRVRIADFAPLCIEATHLPARLCPELLERFEPSGSLYRALGERYGLQVYMADEVAEASVATGAEAKLLRVRGKSPVFRFTRTAYLHNGQPIEFVKSTYRGDRCKVVSRLTRHLELVS